jgi:ATP-dependent Clp protease ATP-binding subunit ClpA
MFSQFGPSARAVVTLAEQECRNASHYYLGTEHLLLAMAIATPSDVAEYFARAGLESWQVKWACRASMDPASDHPWDGVILTPRVVRIFARAAAAAGERRVAPIDILESILEDGGGVAARVIQSLTSREQARTAS